MPRLKTSDADGDARTPFQPIRKRPSRSGLWPAGVYIAPYLSPSGRFVVLALSRGGFLHVAAEVAALKGLHVTSALSDTPLPQILEPRYVDQSGADWGGVIPFVDQRCAGLPGRSLNALLWSTGVHFAPWQSLSAARGGEQVWGRPMIAVDARRRLVAEMLVPKGVDPEPVRRDLLALLESVEESSKDSAMVGRSEGCCEQTHPSHGTSEAVRSDGNDDDDDSGEEWKGALTVNGENRLTRGVHRAPWVGPNGEIVLIAITRRHTLACPPRVISSVGDREVESEFLRGRLDAIDP